MNLHRERKEKQRVNSFKHHDVVFWHLKRKQKVHFSPCFDTSHHAAVTNHLRQNIATIDLFYCSWCLFTSSTKENDICRSLSLHHRRHTSQPQPRTAGTVYQYSIMTCFVRINTTNQTINHFSQDNINRSHPSPHIATINKDNPFHKLPRLAPTRSKNDLITFSPTARYLKCKWLYQTIWLL